MSMQGRLESFSRFKTINAWQDLIQVAFHMHTVDSERGVVACCRGSMTGWVFFDGFEVL